MSKHRHLPKKIKTDNKRIKNSTKECRKDCDVYKDWQQIEADNVGLVLANSKFQAENERLKDKIVQLREWYEIEQLRAEIKQLKDELANYKIGYHAAVQKLTDARERK